VSVKRAIIVALLLVLAANACRRIVDLTPVLSDGGFGDAGIFVDDAHDAVAAFDASIGPD
jgi:hypothetical protein